MPIWEQMVCRILLPTTFNSVAHKLACFEQGDNTIAIAGSQQPKLTGSPLKNKM